MHELTQHVNFTGSKRERERTWDRVLVIFSMPVLEELYNISLKVEIVSDLHPERMRDIQIMV